MGGLYSVLECYILAIAREFFWRVKLGDPDDNAKRRFARWQWRHAIILIGILLSVEQVRSASMVYLQYMRVRDMSIQGELGAVMGPLRKAMRYPVGAEKRAAILEEFLEEHRDEGVFYVSFMGSRDLEMLEAGERLITPSYEEMFASRDFSPLHKEFTIEKGRTFAFMPGFHEIFRQNSYDRAFFGREPGGKPPEGAPTKTRAFVDVEKGRAKSIPLDQLTDQELHQIIDGFPPIQAVEMEPKTTLAMRNRTLAILAVGILGALVTLLGAIYIWWLIGKKQRAEREAEEKRMLATLGKMSAVISHELRNPLAGARGQIELLEMMLYDDKHVERAGRIRGELERLEELSETLLSFVNSRRIEPAVYECSQLVNDLKSLARDKRLEVDTSQMPAEWRYDAITLVRAVDNLVSNALSFTPADGKVYLRLWKKDERLHISVRDEGPGFPADMDDMFEPFVTTRIKGTGLGMAIAAEVVRAHGGEITAQNHPDGGAFLQLWIPKTTGREQATTES